MDSVSEKRESSVDDDVSVADDAEQKVNAAQSKRACDYCHRMKMRCINKENPPCNRCRQSGHPCTFDGPRKSKANRVEDRLKLVETQMSTFQSSLQELLSFHRSSAAPQPQPQTMGPGIPLFALKTGDPAMRTLSTIPPPHVQPQHPTPDSHSTPQTMLNLESLFEASPQQSYANSATPRDRTFAQTTISINTNPPAQPRENPSDKQWLYPTTEFQPTSTTISSAPPSDDEEEVEPLEQSVVTGPWRSMLSLAEAARLEADGHMVKDDVPSPEAIKVAGGKARSHPFDFESDGPTKKKRRSNGDPETMGFKVALPQQKGSHTHAFLDPVDMGFCTEQRGRELFDSFMDNCLFYIPVFDPEVDTWESLRKRSPFAMTAIMMIGAKCEDAGGPPSELHRKCLEHAETIAKSTLFTPIARIEVVQALSEDHVSALSVANRAVVMAAWGDTAWRPAGHALRIATEMGLWKCLPYLVQAGMGAGKSTEEIRDERPLVIGARVWLTLYKTEYQMAFNSGRPTLFMGPETVKDGRQFLRHPLSIPTDSRLVNFCELQTLRLPLHHPFIIWPSSTSIPHLDEKIRQANEGIDAWFQHWDKYYDRLGLPKTHLMRESLITMSAGALVYTNSLILNGVRSKRDISLLSEERHHFLIKGMKAAERIIATALRGRQYAEKFRYANLNTHVNIAFVARFLIRMSSLIPEALNLRQVGRDIEQVVKILTNVPGFQFAQLLRDVLRKARRKHVLPPASKPPSPIRGAAPLPTFTPTSTSPSQIPPSGSGSAAGSDSITFAGMGDPNLSSHLDFSYAEQLFNDSNASFGNGFNFDPITVGPSVTGPSSTADQAFTFDAWYPFPPLESDAVPAGFGSQATPTATQPQGQGQGAGEAQDAPASTMSFLTRPQGNWW